MGTERNVQFLTQGNLPGAKIRGGSKKHLEPVLCPEVVNFTSLQKLQFKKERRTIVISQNFL